MEMGHTMQTCFMWGFDLIELNGDDLRRDPLAVRKATLERIPCQLWTVIPGEPDSVHAIRLSGMVQFAN
jgi:ATP-dependent DNA ligase